MSSPRETTRRRLLRGSSLVGASLLSGCGMFDSESPDDAVRTRTTTSNDGTTVAGTDGGPDVGRVFVPKHFHETAVVERTSNDGLSVALLYSQPDFYWRVRPDASTEQVEPSSDASMQLLAWVWDESSDVVLQDAAVSVEISKDGDAVTAGSLVPLLKQRTGLHWARNVVLPRYGEYDVRLSVETGDCRYGDSLAERVPASSTVDVELRYERGSMDDVKTVYLDQAGKRGAVRPMSTDAVPLTVRPDAADGPGTTLGTATSGAAEVRVRRLAPDRNPLGESTPYLAVTLATPFNEYSLPRAAMTGSLSRNGETVFTGALEPTVDETLGYHYGASVPSLQSGDELAVDVDTPPTVARFEGYERAFRRLSTETIELS